MNPLTISSLLFFGFAYFVFDIEFNLGLGSENGALCAASFLLGIDRLFSLFRLFIPITLTITPY